MTNKLKPTDPSAAAGVNIEAGNTFVDSIKFYGQIFLIIYNIN